MARKTTTQRGYGWRQHGKHRVWWKRYLTTFGPVVCGCKGCPVCGRPPCGRLVYADAAMNPDRRPFHLGHGVALKHGGDGRDSVPWIAECNLRDAACLTNHANHEKSRLLSL